MENQPLTQIEPNKVFNSRGRAFRDFKPNVEKCKTNLVAVSLKRLPHSATTLTGSVARNHRCFSTVRMSMDGLYSGIGLISTFIATKVGESVMRPSDPNRPFGYYADEAIYITFRAVFILGMIVFAGFSACSKIFDFLRGNRLPDLNFKALVIYAVIVTFICSVVVVVHYLNWKKSGSQSDILKIETQSAITDTALSAGIVLAFGSEPLLAQTPARSLLPILDAIVVLVLIAMIIKQPLKTFGDALGEISGKGAEPKLIQAVEAELQQLQSLQDCQIMDVALTKLGRFHLGVVYLHPLYPLSAIAVDQLREEIMDVCRPLVGLIELEIVLTNQPRLINR